MERRRKRTEERENVDFVAPNQSHTDIFSSENLDLCQVVCCLSIILLMVHLDGSI